jgi:transcription elongation factor Elf1
MVSDKLSGLTIDCLTCGASLKKVSAVEREGSTTVSATCTSCKDRFEIRVGRRDKHGQIPVGRYQIMLLPKRRRRK